jgi:hypothetical protein
MERNERLNLPALLLAVAAAVSCGRLPPDLPAEGVGRAVSAERDIPDENAGPGIATVQAGHGLAGITADDAPAFEAVPGDGTEEIDLTGLSTAALYAAVGMMNAHPEGYEGKTVRMAGYFITEQTRSGIRCSCTVPDTAGCCFESVELRCADGIPVLPDDTVVTVSGRFGYFSVNEYLHYTFLEDAAVSADGE